MKLCQPNLQRIVYKHCDKSRWLSSYKFGCTDVFWYLKRQLKGLLFNRNNFIYQFRNAYVYAIPIRCGNNKEILVNIPLL